VSHCNGFSCLGRPPWLSATVTPWCQSGGQMATYLRQQHAYTVGCEIAAMLSRGEAPLRAVCHSWALHCRYAVHTIHHIEVLSHLTTADVNRCANACSIESCSMLDELALPGRQCRQQTSESPWLPSILWAAPGRDWQHPLPVQSHCAAARPRLPGLGCHPCRAAHALISNSSSSKHIIEQCR
jgi:hypothetical protein